MYNLVFVRGGECSPLKEMDLDPDNPNILNIYGRNDIKNAARRIRALEYFKPDIIFCGINLQLRESAEFLRKALRLRDIVIVKNWRLTSPTCQEDICLDRTETKIYKPEIRTNPICSLRTAQMLFAPENESYELFHRETPDLCCMTGIACCYYDLLKLTSKRTEPYWTNVIYPQVKNGKNIIVVANEETIRVILRNIESISFKEALGLKIGKGAPIFYALD